MDMCRIFTEETKKLEKINEIARGYQPRKSKMPPHRRGKREIGLNAINPMMYLDDAKRVENIVDKVYDDLLEQGEKVNYRRVDVEALASNVTVSPQISGRRFDFAPQIITGPNDTKKTNPDTTHVDGPPPPGKTPRFKLSIVPYFIDRKTYDTHLSDMIVKAFDYFEKATCIRLQRLLERPTDKESLQNVEWLYITNPTGIKQCVHSNERALVKGVQMVVLGYECMSLGDILHEIMHVLGFSHEHVRPDRDQFVSIMWDNIKPGYKKYFERMDKPNVEHLPYDYASVLHYPSRAFSKNGQVTIMTQHGIKIGQREGLSEIDIEKINSLYSAECVKRNRQYLLQTCPSVVKAIPEPPKATRKEIEDYYENRLWTFGIVNYKLKDNMEFTYEEKENIQAVIRHIETETCIEFRDLTADPNGIEEDVEGDKDSEDDEDGEDSEDGEDGEDGKVGEDNEEGEDSKDDENGNYGEDSKDDKDGEDDKDGKDDEDDKKGEDGENGEGTEDGKDDQVNYNSSDTAGQLRSSNRVTKKNDHKITLRKNSFALKGKKSKDKKKYSKKSPTRRVHGTKNAGKPLSPSRRHAHIILTFTRSPKPGCPCPTTGVPGDSKIVEINADCFNSVNILLHLFVHLLGLDHQHNSHDRDSYLHILWDQLTEDVKNEMKQKLPPAASAGFAYDYQSVMHYPWLQIKNGRTNIMYPIWNDGWAMGNWQGLSSGDVKKLNLLYQKQCALRRQKVKEAGMILRSLPK